MNEDEELINKLRQNKNLIKTQEETRSDWIMQELQNLRRDTFINDANKKAREEAEIELQKIKEAGRVTPTDFISDTRGVNNSLELIAKGVAENGPIDFVKKGLRANNKETQTLINYYDAIADRLQNHGAERSYEENLKDKATLDAIQKELQRQNNNLFSMRNNLENSTLRGAQSFVSGLENAGIAAFVNSPQVGIANNIINWGASKEEKETNKQSLYDTLTNTFTRQGDMDIQTQQKLNELAYDGLMKHAMSAGYTIGNMTIPILAGIATGGAATEAHLSATAASNLSKFASLGSMYTSVYGNSFKEAIDDGADMYHAQLYAHAMAGIEAGTELISGDSMLSLMTGRPTASLLGKAASGTVKQKIRNKAVASFLMALTDIGGESVEEAISAVADPIAKKTILGGEDIKVDDLLADAYQDAVGALLPSLIFAGVGKPVALYQINNAEIRTINDIQRTTSLTIDQKGELIRKIQEISSDARLGINENYDKIRDSVYNDILKSQQNNVNVMNNALAVQRLTGISDTDTLRLAESQGFVYNPTRMTTQEILDTTTRQTTNYSEAITRDIESLLESDKSLTNITPVTETNKAKQNIANAVSGLTDGQVVFANIATNNGTKVYGLTNGTNIYINAELNDKDTLAAAFHELGHIYAKKNPQEFEAYKNAFYKENKNAEQILKDYNNTIGKYETSENLTEEQKDYLLEELFGDYVGQTMSQTKNTKTLEDSKKNMFDKLKQYGDELKSKYLGTERNNTDVSEYNLDEASYLDTELVSDENLENQVVGMFTDKPEETTKSIFKLASINSPREAQENDVKSRIEEKYKAFDKKLVNMKTVKEMIANELGVEYNDPQVDDIYKQLKKYGEIGERIKLSAKKYNNQYPKGQNLIGYDFKKMVPAKYSNEISGELQTNDDYPNVHFYDSERQFVVSKINTKFKKLPNGSARNITTWTPYDGERTYYFIKNKFNDYTFTLKFSRRKNNEQTTNEVIHDGTSQYGGRPNRQYNKADGQRQDNERNVGLDRNTEAANTRRNTAESNRTLFDNQGRKLSEGQQSYFKNSKVRNESGKLLVVYHGTEANIGRTVPFTVFDLDYAGRHGSALGSGFYFTDDEQRAKTNYATDRGTVYKVYLNITNPFIKPDNLTFTEAVQAINPEHDINLMKNPNTNKLDGNALRRYLIDNGYDGISLNGTYVAFYPEQIKLTTNLNPTTNPDIRFSSRKETNTEKIINNQRNEIERLSSQADDLKEENKGLRKIIKGLKSTGRQQIRNVQSESNKMLRTGREQELKMRGQLEREGKKYNRLSEAAIDIKYENQLAEKARADGISYPREYKDLFIGLRRAGDSIKEAYATTKSIFDESQVVNRSIDNSISILREIRKRKLYNKLPNDIKAKINEYDKIWAGSRQQSNLTLAKRVLASLKAREMLGNIAMTKGVRNQIMSMEGYGWENGKGSVSLQELFNESKELAIKFEQGLLDLRKEIADFQAIDKNKERATQIKGTIDSSQEAVLTEEKKQDKLKIKGLTKKVTNKTLFNSLMTLKAEIQALMGGNINTPLMAINNNLQNGELRKKQAIVEMYRILSDFMRKSSGVNRVLNTQRWSKSLEKSLSNSSEWIDTGYKVKAERGGTSTIIELKLPRSMAMSLAMHLLNDDNMLHISGGAVQITVDDNGNVDVKRGEGKGVQIPDEELFRRGKEKEAYDRGATVKLTHEQVEKIAGMLTTEEKAFVKATQEVFKYTTELINEVSNRVFGYDLATVENYFPIRVGEKGESKGAVINAPMQKMYGDALSHMLNPGWLQQRVTSFNPI